MGFFDDIFGQPFGGMFDFNGDGKTDFGEEWVGYMIINDCMKEEEKRSSSYSASGYHSGNIDLYDSVEDDVFIDPVDPSKEFCDDNWRIFCEDGSDYGLYPEDFDSEEDYLEALAEAKLIHGDVPYYGNEDNSAVSATLPLKLTFEFTYPGKEQLEALNEADYPNKRSYRAAYGLCELQHGNPYIPSDSSKEKEAERFNFILSGNCIAAKYLTPYDGFIYAQAVKENFTLPISVDDEDEESSVWFPDVFMEIAEEDSALAVEVWAWCIKEFGPYQNYMKTKPILYSYITSSTDEYPPEFLDLAIDKLGNDVAFSEALLSRSPELMYGISSFIGRALETGKNKEAQIIFTSFMLNPKVKGKNAEDFINSIISHCSNWEELETMESFKFYILPIVKKMNDKRIQRLLPKFADEIDHYIISVESSEDKYQYARSFAWRTKYKEEHLFDLEPLDFNTEEEYLRAVETKKTQWKRTHAEAKFYGINMDGFSSEQEYQSALEKKKAALSNISTREAERESCRFSVNDEVYNFCSVIFQNGSKPYIYLCEIKDVKIGDYVIVPVGNKNYEVVAQVISLSQHTAFSAPIEITEAKKVLRISKTNDK